MIHQVLSVTLVLICVGMAICILQLTKRMSLLQAEVEQVSKQLEQISKELEEAVRRLAQYEVEPRSKVFSRTVDLVAAAGVPGLILMAAIAVSGFSGAAAITTALASLGGPAGMLGGIGLLVTIGVLIAKYGATDLASAVVCRLRRTKSKAEIIQEIDALPRIVPQKFRVRAKELLDS